MMRGQKNVKLPGNAQKKFNNNCTVWVINSGRMIWHVDRYIRGFGGKSRGKVTILKI
jgi:hypothetical protein